MTPDRDPQETPLDTCKPKGFVWQLLCDQGYVEVAEELCAGVEKLELALRAAEQRTAAGVVVPREPTASMLYAATKVMTANGKPLWVTLADNGLTSTDIAIAYKAMLLSTAPQPDEKKG